MLGVEMPPTAGLPLRLGDLFGSGPGLEEALAAQLGVPRPLFACSGSACLVVALLTFKRRKPGRSRVIVPAYTCPLVARVIERAGLRTVACELRPDHFDFDPDALAQLCDERTLAILPTHLGGRLADVQASFAIARRHGAFVIEDAAQALGARTSGVSVGLTADAGFFSLAVGKGLTTFEGGLLINADEQLRDEMAWTHTQIAATNPALEGRRVLELLAYWVAYRPRLLGLAYGWPRRRALRRKDLIAAVGDDVGIGIPIHRPGRWRQRVGASASIRLPEFLRSTAVQAHRRVARLNQIEGVRVLDDSGTEARGVWPVLMVMMADRQLRDRVLDRLWRSPLGVSRMFINTLADTPGLTDIEYGAVLTNARNFAARMLTISNSPWLDDRRFDEILAVLVEESARNQGTEPTQSRPR
jgi:perosamine synthetase